jgi:16S rRNA (uracil1498-N3)-methyltransferase
VDPSAHKLDRLRRHAEESLKQCGRAWLMEIGEATTFADALASRSSLILADASGGPFSLVHHDQTNAATPRDPITLLIGPEGGFSPEEIASARHARATIASFGMHVMRIEVAAVAACAIVMHQRFAQPVAVPPE